MKQFAADFRFVRVTSSPKYPQANSEAERAVQTVKNLLKKAKDPYNPIAHGAVSSHHPTYLFPARLQPALPDLQALLRKEREKRLMDAKCFDERHRARALTKLSAGDQVWITDVKAQGTVTSVHDSPRSYLVSGPKGTLRRNRQHLVPMPDSHENQPEQGEISTFCKLRDSSKVSSKTISEHTWCCENKIRQRSKKQTETRPVRKRKKKKNVC